MGDLDALVEAVAARVYGPLDPDDGSGWLDPLYAWIEAQLAAGVASDAEALAEAWLLLVDQEASALVGA